MRPFGDLAITEPVKNRAVAEGQPPLPEGVEPPSRGSSRWIVPVRHGPTSVVADVPPKTAAAEDETAQRGAGSRIAVEHRLIAQGAAGYSRH